MTVKIGTAQFSELTWQRRKLERFQVSKGMLLPQLADGDPMSASSVYLPYSIGLLQAHVQQHAAEPGRYEFLPTLFQRVAVSDAADALARADVIAFSAYVWNFRLSLEIAAECKNRNPEALVVFGGPQVPDDAERFLHDAPYIDVAVHGEGEPVFLELLEALPGRDWTGIPSVSFRGRGGSVVRHPRAKRLRELEQIPSPYLSGVFDDLMRGHPGSGWLATWETNRGCPFSCSFCDWGSAVTGKVNRFPMERLEQEADWFAQHGISHVFLVDANFGILKRDIDIARMLVGAFERHHAVAAVSVQSAKNAADRTYEVQRTLAGSRAIQFVGATMALQSMSEEALLAVKRDNISLDDYRDLQQRYRASAIPTYTDLIMGLPGETFESFADGLGTVMGEGQHNRLAVYNCSILPNAEMGDPAYQALHGIEAVPVPIVHEHDALDTQPFVREYLDVVIATSTMLREDWVRTRVFASMTELLHYDRLLQIPFVVLANELGVPYRALLQTFVDADESVAPVTASLRQDCADRARAIQRGEPEFIPSERYLSIWWPIHQHGLLRVVLEGLLDGLYGEARRLLGDLLTSGRPDALAVLDDALALNRAMIPQPRIRTDERLVLSHNILEYYESVVANVPATLLCEETVHHVDRTSTVWLSEEAWCEDVVLTLYNRGQLLYPAATVRERARVASVPVG